MGCAPPISAHIPVVDAAACYTINSIFPSTRNGAFYLAKGRKHHSPVYRCWRPQSHHQVAQRAASFIRMVFIDTYCPEIAAISDFVRVCCKPLPVVLFFF